MFKEELRPKAADALLFALAPMIAATVRFAAFAVVPVRRRDDAVRSDPEGIRLQVADVNVAILSCSPSLDERLRDRARRWSSNSKYSLLGGLRSSAQMISYELSYGLALASVLVIGNSLSLTEIVNAQGGTWLGFIPKWFVFLQPVGFFVYMTAGIAETNRAPFDFPEAEQELVAGYHTEYSSMTFAMFFMAEYINMVTVSAVATDLFLGGWHGPFLPESLGGSGSCSRSGDSVLLRVDAVDAAALPLRSADAVRLEGAAAAAVSTCSRPRAGVSTSVVMIRCSICSRAVRSCARCS
jgi:NADH-quinone oxidoreductase subunit H